MALTMHDAHSESFHGGDNVVWRQESAVAQCLLLSHSVLGICCKPVSVMMSAMMFRRLRRLQAGGFEGVGDGYRYDVRSCEAERDQAALS